MFADEVVYVSPLDLSTRAVLRSEKDRCMLRARAAHENHVDYWLHRRDDDLAAAWLALRNAYIRRARRLNRRLV